MNTANSSVGIPYDNTGIIQPSILDVLEAANISSDDWYTIINNWNDTFKDSTTYGRSDTTEVKNFISHALSSILRLNENIPDDVRTCLTLMINSMRDDFVGVTDNYQYIDVRTSLNIVGSSNVTMSLCNGRARRKSDKLTDIESYA